MERNDLTSIARDFRRLSRRFEGYAKRARKARHLAVDIQQTAVQAGRLLIAAIDAGGFPETLHDQNGGWWDRSIGRVPGNVLAVLGRMHWHEGQPPPHRQAEYLAAAAKPLEPGQFLMCWIFAIGSWLVCSFPERFREGAGEWDWTHVATNKDGLVLGKDGKPLVGHWYKNGVQLPDDFKWSPSCNDGDYAWRLEGEAAHETDSYTEDDWLAHQRIRAEVYADACLVLSELIGHAAPLDQQSEFTPTPDDVTILRDIADCKTTRVQADIEASTYLSRKKIGKRLKVLEEHGLVHYPHGRRGVAITGAGRALLAEIASQSYLPQHAQE